MNRLIPSCIYCDCNSEQVPLISWQFQGNQYWICPQHLPILIHKPANLADKVPGLERLGPPEGH
jgi:hypothetical protein